MTVTLHYHARVLSGDARLKYRCPVPTVVLEALEPGDTLQEIAELQRARKIPQSVCFEACRHGTVTLHYHTNFLRRLYDTGRGRQRSTGSARGKRSCLQGPRRPCSDDAKRSHIIEYVTKLTMHSRWFYVAEVPKTLENTRRAT